MVRYNNFNYMEKVLEHPFEGAELKDYLPLFRVQVLGFGERMFQLRKRIPSRRGILSQTSLYNYLNGGGTDMRLKDEIMRKGIELLKELKVEIKL